MKRIFFKVLVCSLVSLIGCNNKIDRFTDSDFIKPKMESFIYLLELPVEECKSLLIDLHYIQDKDSTVINFDKAYKDDIHSISFYPKKEFLHISMLKYSDSNSYTKFLKPNLRSHFIKKIDKVDFYEFNYNNKKYIVSLETRNQEEFNFIKLHEQINIYKEGYFSSEILKKIKN